MTGYQIAKLVNAKLDELGIKVIPPQMIYSYMKNGYISREDEQKQIEWIDKYIAKKIEKKSSEELEMKKREIVKNISE